MMLILLAACSGSDGPEATEDQTLSLTLSEEMATVVIAEWQTDAAQSVRGLFWEDDGDVRQTDWSAEGTEHRLTLLGNHQNSTVSVQVEHDDGTLSAVQTITTGLIDASLPAVVTETLSDDLADGYLLVPILGEDSSGLSSPGVAVLDRDGYVWAKPYSTLLTAVDLSADGALLGFAGAEMLRWSAEGTLLDPIALQDGHHDFTQLPDGTLAWTALAEVPDNKDLITDRVFERAPDGTVTEIFNVSEHFEALNITEPEHLDTVPFDLTHANSLAYDASADRYLLNLTTLPAVVAFSRSTGEIDWVVHGAGAVGLDFALDDPYTLSHQLTPVSGGYLQFVNTTMEDTCSRVVRIAVDESGGSAQQTGTMGLSDCRTVFALGGVQELPSASTLITWSTAGVIEELDASGEVVWRVTSDFGSGFGYGVWLESLDGWE